ncbi:UNVERIFIED_CONTAM: hypothetical protein HHA_214575 [Hammondia hammondi]|eukprot:XP_008886728.1 hypothetical protein HHA_214575 [Hammondia hammondi]
MGNICQKPTIVERPPIRNIGKYSVDVGPVNVDRTGRCTRRIVQGIGANFHIQGLEAGKTYRVSFNCPYVEDCRGGDQVTFTTATV